MLFKRFVQRKKTRMIGAHDNQEEISSWSEFGSQRSRSEVKGTWLECPWQPVSASSVMTLHSKMKWTDEEGSSADM